MVPENVRGHYAREVTLWIDVPKEQRITASDIMAYRADYATRRRYRDYRNETRLNILKDPTAGCRAAVRWRMEYLSAHGYGTETRRTKWAPCSAGMGVGGNPYFCKQHRYGDASRFKSDTWWKRISLQPPIKHIKLQLPVRWRHG